MRTWTSGKTRRKDKNKKKRSEEQTQERALDVLAHLAVIARTCFRNLKNAKPSRDAATAVTTGTAHPPFVPVSDAAEKPTCVSSRVQNIGRVSKKLKSKKQERVARKVATTSLNAKEQERERNGAQEKGKSLANSRPAKSMTKHEQTDGRQQCNRCYLIHTNISFLKNPTPVTTFCIMFLSHEINYRPRHVATGGGNQIPATRRAST